MDSQNERKASEQPGPTEAAPPPKKRHFQIVKLEERIAPDKGGVTNKAHGCSGGGSTSSGFSTTISNPSSY
jgi:hypothetical protein